MAHANQVTKPSSPRGRLYNQHKTVFLPTWLLTKIGFYSITSKPSHLNPDGPAVFNIRGRDKEREIKSP